MQMEVGGGGGGGREAEYETVNMEQPTADKDVPFQNLKCRFESEME